MSINMMDELIELQRPQRTPDGGGGYDEEWETYAAEWAWVKPLSGQERYQAQQTAATANYRIRIHYRDDIDAADRILWRGKLLNIRFPADAGPRALWLDIDAEITP